MNQETRHDEHPHELVPTRPAWIGIIRIGLIGLGLILLVAGVLTAAPYIRSRLAPIPVQYAAEVHAAVPVDAASDAPGTPTPRHARAEAATQTVAVVKPEDTPPPKHSPSAEPTFTPPPTSALPSRLTIPSINVDAPVVTAELDVLEVAGQSQSTWDVPDEYAAGWHANSATLGLPGNTVLNGHNTTFGEVFRNLYQVRAGDIITLYSNDVAYTYAVSETLILPEAGQPLEVRRENARYILPTDDERLTIVTCHPYGSLRNRLIVIAMPAEAKP